MGKGIVYLIITILTLLVISSCSAENKQGMDTNEKPMNQDDIADQYDVIVIGGEPEGVAAAVSAARNGAKTLLVEKREDLGGLFTYGKLAYLDIPLENGKSVSRGIFEEWHQLVGSDDAFGISDAKAAFKKLIDGEENITLAANTEVIKPVVKGNRVIAVNLKNKDVELEVKGNTFIDATQDADFAVMSGVPAFTGGEDIGNHDTKMAATLIIHLKNVDWEGIKQTAQSEKFGPAEVTGTISWGYASLNFDYEPVEEDTRLRGLNIAKADDEYFINGLQIFGIDGLDEQSIEDGIKRGRNETDHILPFLNREFPGFEQAEIISYPTELYVRETRHILAEYQLPMSDIWINRDHWDSIGFGAYPVDVQAQTPEDYGYVMSNPKRYAIPFRSLIPLEIDDLLVVGRSAGYSSLAAGSARIVPTGMTTGEAAGAAAALANEENITFREMSKEEELIEILRERLANQGAFVDHYEADYPYQEEWFDNAIQTVIDYGVVYGDYDNNLFVENAAKSYPYINMLREVTARSSSKKYVELKSNFDLVQREVFAKENEVITRDEASKLIVDIFFEESSDHPWDTLIEKGIITKELEARISNDRDLFIKEMIALNAAIIEYINE